MAKTAPAKSFFERRQFGIFAGLLFLLAALVLSEIAVGVSTRWLTGLLFGAAMVVWIFVVRLSSRGGAKPAIAAAIIGVTLVGCVAMAPGSSNDVSSYSMYGRMVSHYDMSPYTHAPADFPADPLAARVSTFWADSPSVYGPVFTIISAGVTSVAGTSVTTARLGFQLVALLAYLAIVALLWFRTKRLDATLLFAANPLVLAFGVNDAHCDIILGAAILAAVPLLDHKKWVGAGLFIALACLIKITALPALLGAVVWALAHREKRGTVITAIVGGGVTVGGLIVADLGNYINAFSEVSNRQSRFSLFSPVHGALEQITSWSPSTVASVTTLLADAVIAVVGLALIWMTRKMSNSVIALTGALLAYQVFGAYTLGWYSLWSLPALALLWALDSGGMTKGRVLAVVVIAHGAWVSISYFSGYFSIAVVAAAVAFAFVTFAQRRKLTSGPV